MQPRVLSLLRVRLLLMKWGAANALIAVLVLLASAAYLIALPHAKQRLRLEQQHLARLTQAREASALIQTPAPAPRALNDVRMARFYQQLGERDYTEQQLKTLFAIAARTTLTLQQGDYTWVEEGAGLFATYRVQLPVKGSYAAIQQFCEQVLLAMPFASLDQLSFRRDAAGASVIDAQLSFTLYLAGQTLPAAAVSASTETDR